MIFEIQNSRIEEKEEKNFNKDHEYKCQRFVLKIKFLL